MVDGRHGSLEELFWVARHGREAQTSCGGRQAGAPYRWKVAPLPGKRGWEEAGDKIERSGIDG